MNIQQPRFVDGKSLAVDLQTPANAIAGGLTQMFDNQQAMAKQQKFDQANSVNAFSGSILQSDPQNWPEMFMAEASRYEQMGDMQNADEARRLAQLPIEEQKREMQQDFMSSSNALGRDPIVGLRKISGADKKFALQGSQDPNLYKDSRGELYKLRQVQDPNTKEYYTQYTSVSPNAGDPKGQVTLASKDYYTSKEDAIAEARIEQARQDAKNISDNETAANKEEQKQLGKLRGELNSDEVKSFRNVRSQKLQLDQLEKALNAASTGKYAQLKSFAGKYIPGVNVDDEQALQSIVTSYALAELQKQTGPKTDFDFIKAAETQIQVGNTKGANEIILRRMRENAEYGEQRWNAYKAYKSKNRDVENFEDTFTFESSLNTGGNAVITGKDRQALEWAESNPDDPRAKQILLKLGK